MATRIITFEMVDNPVRCGGKPCLPGHRITINQIIGMVLQGTTRDEILDYWGRDYFEFDLNDYIDFAERVIADNNGFCPGGLKFAKTWEEASEEYKEYSPYGGHDKVLVLTPEDVELFERTGGFGEPDEKV